MSEEVQTNTHSVEVSGFSGGTYDYLSQGKEAQPSKEEGKEKEDAPWKPPQDKEKDGTPAWARKRFHELTSAVKEERAKNQRLQEGYEALMKSYNPEDGEIKLDKFKKKDGSPDYEGYTKAVLDAQLKAARTQWEKDLTERQQAQSTRAELEKVANDNYTKTKEEIPDLDLAMNSLDPGLEIDQGALNHLMRSPFGYKTLYRIGMDSELQDRLMQMDVATRTSEIAKIHDAILNYTVAQEQKNQNLKQNNQAPIAPARPAKPVPAPPPKQRGMGDIGKASLNMSGDDWIKARNQEKKR